MRYSSRIFYTETDKSEMWDRSRKGESLNSIEELTYIPELTNSLPLRKCPRQRQT